ncbi:polysaccharide lyase family 8 super-sandwich domain-containing protein [Stigmatella erecta]|uniref:polysaccharide lyase family 8 super-sandwich domain-containing protein n=1 Tax=Stigmatella erecta TaxID=83460 RepID=UPI0015A6385D|nr:polysaccharide lyase family 8 super-sandwich domain-containing protein [Stigmatella erecta]
MVLSPRAALADSHDTLRLRWAETLVAAEASVRPEDPVIVNGLNKLTAQGQKRWDEMEKAGGRTYLWKELASNSSSNVTNAYKRLYEIAVAVRYDSYAAATVKLTHAAQAKRDLIGALDWMLAYRYKNPAEKQGNWFDWEIGAPQELLNIVVLLWDDLTPAQRDNYTKSVLAHVKPGLDYTGANGTSQTRIWALLGVLRKNRDANGNSKDYLAEVQGRINSMLAVPYTALPAGTNTKSGMYADGSFIEHYRHAYNGGYGASYLTNLVNVLYLLKDSSWQPNLGNVTNFIVPWVFQAYDLSMYKRMFFHSVKGRYVSRVGETYDSVADGTSVGQAVTRLIEVAPSWVDRQALRSAVREWNDSNTSASHMVRGFVGSSIHDYAHAIQFIDTIPRRGPLTAYKQYPWMNRAMAHRPGWAASVAMYNKDDVRGTRLLTLSNETLQQETLKGLHLSDGTLQVMNDDFGQYNSDYFKYVDWERLPGTTVAYGYGIPVNPPNTSPPLDERHRNLSNWAGGVGVDEFGATGFQLNPASTAQYGHLHARKAWFFLDKEIVCIGSDIRITNAQETHPLQTIIENWKLNQAGNNTFTVDGVVKPTTLGWSETMQNVRWAHLQGMVPGTDTGYYLPTPGRVFALREQRGPQESFMTLWSDHGTQFALRSYGYVVLPNHDAAQTKAYADAAPISILENSPDAQAVRKASIGVTGALFLKDQVKTITLPDSTASALKSDRNAAVMVHTVPGEVRVGISDPTWENTGTISIELWPAITGNVAALVSKDPRITVLQTAPTLRLAVNVKDAQGQTLTARFTLK